MAATSPLHWVRRSPTSTIGSLVNFGSWFMTAGAIFPQPWQIQGTTEALRKAPRGLQSSGTHRGRFASFGRRPALQWCMLACPWGAVHDDHTQYHHVFEAIEPVPGSGLKVMRCKVCGGVPATTFGARSPSIEIARTLTRDCCGRMLTDDETSEIAEGLDFRDGQWVTPK
jgi:hypothetical protein